MTPLTMTLKYAVAYYAEGFSPENSGCLPFKYEQAAIQLHVTGAYP